MKQITFTSNENFAYITAINNFMWYIAKMKNNEDLEKIDDDLWHFITANLNLNPSENRTSVVEINMRIWHFFLFDYGDEILFNKAFSWDDSLRASIKSNVFWLFEIVQINNNSSVVIKDMITSQEYEITEEFEWSEYSLTQLNIGTRIISRILKNHNEWYVLKNYYYFPWEENKLWDALEKYFKSNKNIKLDLYMVEKIIFDFNSLKNWSVSDTNINYYKRFLNSIKNVLSKNDQKEIKKIIDNLEVEKPETILSIMNFLIKIKDNKKVSHIISSLFDYLYYNFDEEDVYEFMYIFVKVYFITFLTKEYPFLLETESDNNEMNIDLHHYINKFLDENNDTWFLNFFSDADFDIKTRLFEDFNKE